MSTRFRLIELLSSGGFFSGPELARELGVSRAAVWKQVQALSEMGVEVYAVRGRGYRIRDRLQLLDRKRVLAEISPPGTALLESLEIFDSIDSTSEYLRKGLSDLPPGTGRACLAEQQTAGRGRRGRHWVSPYGRNLYLSLAWHIEQAGISVAGLSLAIAISVTRTLEHCGVPRLGLKWPNDIFLDGGKLAGILLDLSGESGGTWRVIAGVGINVDMPEGVVAAIDQPWADLSAADISVDRSQLAGKIFAALINDIGVFAEHGLAAFCKEWARFDLIADKAIELHTGDGMISGFARGIDRDGALLLEHNGITSSYHAGEVSVRIAG